MAKRIVKVEPGANGVGQTVTFDDGSTEFDAYGTARADADVTAPATTEPEKAAPSLWAQAMTAMSTPAASQLGGASPVAATQPNTEMAKDRTSEGAQLRYDQANPTGPGAAQRLAAAGMQPLTAGPDGLVKMEPGAADSITGEQPGAMPSLSQVVVPGQAGGMQLTGKQTSGYSSADRASLGENAQFSAEQGRQAKEAEIKGQESYVGQLETDALQRYQKAEAEALAAAAEQKRNQMVQKNIQTKLQDASKFKPNRNELFEGTGGGFRALAAGLGMIAGGMLAGLNGGRNQAEDAVFKMIDDNVRDQVAQNTGVYNELVRRLGDETAAAEVLRSKHLGAVSDMTKALELTAKTKELRAGLAGARERADFEQSQSLLKAQQALTPQETLAMSYRAPTPAAILTIDRDQQALHQLLGPDADKKVGEFMKEKISGQQNAKTVGEAVQYMKEMSADANTLRAIAATHDGKLPGQDQILSPSKSPMLRAALARLGIDHDVAASEVYKIVGSLIAKRAKSYGGAITESDLTMAQGEVGVTGSQILDFMRRMHGEANGQLKATAYGYFQGRSQPVIDIITHGIGTMQGFKEDKGRPRGESPLVDRRVAPERAPASFETPLSSDEEANFQVWKKKYAPNDSGADYDLRGAFKAGLRPSAKNGHWPDTFKKPNHETFSVESKYAKDAPDRAGHWEGDVYVKPNGEKVYGK